MTARKSSLQIARLRAAGAKVSTVLGHPRRGTRGRAANYHYSITTPGSAAEARNAAKDMAQDLRESHPGAVLWVHRDRWDPKRTLIYLEPRPDYSNPKSWLSDADLAKVLGAMAEVLLADLA